MGSNSLNKILILISAFCASGISLVISDASPAVTTPKGTFVGTKVTVDGKNVYAFYGLPYAKAPIGPLRFKRPEPADTLQDPYDATTLPNACPQPVANAFPNFQGERMWNPNTNMSEDCLVLNIWVPEEAFQHREEKKVPVFLWLHGGGFFTGSISLDVYNGAGLAATEGVVVVNVQYRLGPLGFLYFGNDDAPGNVGLLDQALGIKWTKDNIGFFGGDSETITLSGESCGAASVGYHLVSPISKNNFKRGMMTSGLPSVSYSFLFPEEAKARSYQLAKFAGCKNKNCKQIVECLRKVDSAKLIALQWKLYKDILDFPLSPTIDGYFLPDHPDTIISKGRAKRSELILGTVRDEGTFFVIYQFIKTMSHLKPTDITRDKFLEIMEDVFKHYNQKQREAIILKYTNWDNPDDGYMNQQRIGDAIGDAWFVCPHRKFADAWSNRGLPVYYYHLTQRSKLNPWGEWAGVMHGDDIPVVFGNALANPAYPDEEKQMSLKFMDLVGKFMKTGSPSPNWERYTSEHPVYLDVNATIITDHSNPNLQGPRANECVFWNKLIPLLAEESKDQLGNKEAHSHDQQPSCPKTNNPSKSHSHHGQANPCDNYDKDHEGKSFFGDSEGSDNSVDHMHLD